MRKLKETARSVTAAAGIAFLPSAALACPGCMIANPKTAATYFSMTVVMSSLPILLICGIGYWLWRRYQ